MDYREYDPEKDKDAAHRIWRETGWIESDESETAMDLFLSGARALVADIDGEPECLVASQRGDMRYLDQEVRLGIVSAVTTSRIARKQGYAGRLTAQLIARQVDEGAAVSALGMFEQGFYNRLGFGTGSYEHIVRFDPATLRVPGMKRPPKRLSADNVEAMYAARLNRYRTHGGCNVYPVESFRGELTWSKANFGLGYYEDDGQTLSHYLWAGSKGENGPYRIDTLVYNTPEQFLELMAVIKSLGDQVHAVRMHEPAHIQLQDLIVAPFRQYHISEKSDYSADNQAYAYWQMRICDLAACLAVTHLCGEPVRFNLSLRDPIDAYLDAAEPWRGVGGDYIVTLGPDSAAQPGSDPNLPTMHASVNAFTRMWLGVRPATGLAITDDLEGPAELLADLDKVLCLPVPHTDWDF